ncbi:MAG: hypothetical protein JNK79_14060 [Chitinophagaceae bacterium]|nr:hypothetical protein [Chitinophagaceae bacterium]
MSIHHMNIIGKLFIIVFPFFFAEFTSHAQSATQQTAPPLTIYWENNNLTISGGNIPGNTLQINYLEDFCKSGSTNRKWNETTIPHKTELVYADENRKHIKLRTFVEGDIEVDHDIRAGEDDITFNLVLENKSDRFADVVWFQPCVRVDRFTNKTQDDYIDRCFIFTGSGLKTLNNTVRSDKGLYKGGQTYVPPGIDLNDVNPRPISPEKPINGLIGCFSDDNKWLMATAWDHVQELFQGVFVCIHSDPRIGGLGPGELKKLKGKIYFLPNDTEGLLKRYRRDF